MSIIVNLTPTEENRLSTEAIQNGIATSDLVAKLLRDHLISKTKTEEVRAKLRQWQTETATVTTSSIPARELFARWAEEDAHMTEDEKEAEDRLWQDFQSGINETRVDLNMRQL